MPQRRATRNGVYPPLREYYQNMGRGRRLSPRALMAVQLYSTGAAKTIKEAAEAVGMTQVHLSNILNHGGGGGVRDQMQKDIAEAAINTSALIERLGGEAVARIADHMRNAQSEVLRFRAAQDLADRAPATSKTQKIQADVFTLGMDSAKVLAAAMIRAQEVKQFTDAVQGDYIKVPEEDAQKLLPSETSNGLDQGTAGGSAPPIDSGAVVDVLGIAAAQSDKVA